MPPPRSTECPICKGTAQPFDLYPGDSALRINCENCGEFYTTYEHIADRRSNLSIADRAHVSGWIRDRWRRGEKDILVLSTDVDAVLRGVPQLTPAEKAQHLLLTLARVSEHPGTEIPRHEIRHSDAWALNPNELGIYLRWLHTQGFVAPYETSTHFSLSLDGWIEVDRLQKQRATSGTQAFMAMPFGDTRLDRIVADYFVPAAKAAGFNLRRLNEGQPAGLIDDQLRVRLRTARFVVADLTNGNQGAYWEAGFAEGLETPVIYTCERAVFDHPDRRKGPHFDTNHLVTVLWEDGKLESAAKELTTRIRATLPHEAKLEDDLVTESG
jgi:hypothetical protein